MSRALALAGAALLAASLGTPVSLAGPLEAPRYEAPRQVTIPGYADDAMEPDISSDGRLLFWNDGNANPTRTDLHWARRIDDTTFDYGGPLTPADVPGVLDATPSVSHDLTTDEAVESLVEGAAAALSAPAVAAGQAPGADAVSPVCTTGPAEFPRPLALPGAEPNGAFDPDVARDESSGRLWMAYSAVTGPAGSGYVSTHLAWSDDEGLTWCESGTVNAASRVPEEEQPPAIAGPDAHWNHEVPALVYDAVAPASERWTLIWHRYLHVADDDPSTDDRRFQYGWIAARTAATAEALAVAPERKLFSSIAYHARPEVEAYNEAIVGGSPLKRWDSDPELGGCLVFTEPALLAVRGTLYAALYCFRSPDRQDVVLVARAGPRREWSPVGTLLTTGDAAALDPALVGFNAPDLYSIGSSVRLLVSPTVGGAYRGCLEYELDLAAGRLRDANGDGPDTTLGLEANPAADVFQTGACTYHEGLATGVVRGDTHFGVVQFRLVATGTAPRGSTAAGRR